jgi:hypothetical protein
VKNNWKQTPFLEYQAVAGSLLKGRRAEDLDTRLGENDKGTHEILAPFRKVFTLTLYPSIFKAKGNFGKSVILWA